MAYDLGQIDPEERTELYADQREEENAPRPHRLLRVGGALIVMAVFAGGLWLAYVEGVRHAGGPSSAADIPLIRADTRPMKVKPENPGGMQIPDRDMLIYGQPRPQVEHLLPPPEQPMARPAPPPPVQPAAVVPPPAPPAGFVAASAEAGAPDHATKPPAAPSASAPAQLSPAAAAAARELAPMPTANPTKAGATRAAAAGAGALRLQLGAVRSETEARGTWERLKRQNADLLGRLSAVAIRADLGDKGIYYRIEAGPVGDASTADRICGGLRQRRLACVIVR